MTRETSAERSAHTSVEQLLRWRLARAEAEAPPAPRAARLLEQARPWWERWPEQFRARVQRLSTIQVAYGYAMVDTQGARGGHPVPALIAQAEDLETFARVLYLSVHGSQLRLRFQLHALPARSEPAYEVTFVSDADARPLLAAHATLSVGCEYRLDTELAEELATSWGALKVTDRMPFRFILRPASIRE